jgi:hypothetical protein
VEGAPAGVAHPCLGTFHGNELLLLPFALGGREDGSVAIPNQARVGVVERRRERGSAGGGEAAESGRDEIR